MLDEILTHPLYQPAPRSPKPAGKDRVNHQVRRGAEAAEGVDTGEHEVLAVGHVVFQQVLSGSQVQRHRAAIQSPTFAKA